MNKRFRRAAFTLIELMVALSAGTVAIAAVYYLSGTASRTYSTQLKVADTQMNLRMAMEQVRRDFTRAGYLAVSNTAILAPGAGPRATTNFMAFAATADGSMDGPNTALVGANATRLDSLMLVANYATSEDYVLDEGFAGLGVDVTQQAFVRSFGMTVADWAAPFEDVFRPGRQVRLEDGAMPGSYYFYDIQSALGATPPMITVTTQIPPAIQLAGAAIAPIVQLQYLVTAIDGVTDPTMAALNSNAPGAARMALIRREINMTTGQPVDGSERLVLDYVTEFDIAVMQGTAPTWGPPFTLVADPTGLGADSIASVIVTLSARSPEVDRQLSHIGRLASGAMVTFQVSDDPLDPNFGVSRVRTIRTEIFMHNL